MKLLKYTLFAFFAMIMFSSCENFLTFQDKDKVIPKSLSSYEELIFGELLRKKIDESLYKMEILTDDVDDFIASYATQSDVDNRFRLQGWYTWSVEPQISSAGDEEIDECWEFFYRKILMCNVIEEKVAEFEDGGLKFRLLGEVQFLRAMSYYYLVNTYGEPYENMEQSKTALGVPINNETSIRNKLYQRATLRAVYDFIESNLVSAGKNLEKGDGRVTKFRPNIDAVRLMLSRLYLYQKEYDKVITVTNELIATSPTSIETLINMEANKDFCFYNATNTGIFFTWGDAGYGTLGTDAYSNIKFKPSNELIAMYKTGDARLACFLESWGNYIPKKHPSYSQAFYKNCYRIEEAYLNRAEAYAEKGEISSALKDINDIRKERFRGVPYEKNSNDKAELIQIVRDERRMELCFEDHRWFDIRRWGLEIIHTFKDRNAPANVEVYKLKKGSPNYILPLPLTEQRLNNLIVKFNRENCKVTL